MPTEPQRGRFGRFVLARSPLAAGKPRRAAYQPTYANAYSHKHTKTKRPPLPKTVWKKQRLDLNAYVLCVYYPLLIRLQQVRVHAAGGLEGFVPACGGVRDVRACVRAWMRESMLIRVVK